MITHVHRQFAGPWETQTPIGNGNTENDVWEEIRQATLNDEAVLFPETHQYAEEEFRDELEKDYFDLSLVKFLTLDPLTKTIHIPAQARGSRLVRASDNKVVAENKPQATPATTKEIVVERYCNFSTKQNARMIASRVTDLIRMVVIWEPYVEAGDLDHLSELPSDVHVVIFHRLSEKCGVVIEGDPENWEDDFPVMGECELPQPEPIVDGLLLKGTINVIAGRFETYKTMALVELCSAVLTGRPVFDHFKVLQRYPFLFLEQDMSPELFQEYARPFGLMEHKDFRWQKPGADCFHAVDSPVLQHAVRGRILILDTMLDYARIENAYESGEWITFMQQLRELITVHGCIAVIMTAHATKTGAKATTIDPSEYFKDSATFGGKVDVGYGFKQLAGTSQVQIDRIKQRGFKKGLSFTIAVYNDDGASNLSEGRFPVYQKPGEVKAGPKVDSDKQQKINFARSVDGSMQDKADAVNEKFGSKHSRSTIYEWLKPFDAEVSHE